jgi:FkbM family methyltransferase
VVAHSFEPTAEQPRLLPLCVSNHNGTARFHVARDERASSFHPVVEGFVERFGMDSLYAERTIDVACVTLDEHFAGRFSELDALDVNVEGHDLQVLQGASELLKSADLKLIKVEFEVAGVWDGQGWFSDIDSLLRGYRYDLIGLDVEFARPVDVRHCFHKGEPIWGKALYAPSRSRLQAMFDRNQEARSTIAMIAKTVALYVAADAPGRAFDALDVGGAENLDVKRKIEGAYRWAKLEHAAEILRDLFGRATGLRRASS